MSYTAVDEWLEWLCEHDKALYAAVTRGDPQTVASIVKLDEIGRRRVEQALDTGEWFARRSRRSRSRDDRHSTTG